MYMYNVHVHTCTMYVTLYTCTLHVHVYTFWGSPFLITGNGFIALIDQDKFMSETWSHWFLGGDNSGDVMVWENVVGLRAAVKGEMGEVHLVSLCRLHRVLNQLKDTFSCPLGMYTVFNASCFALHAFVLVPACVFFELCMYMYICLNYMYLFNPGWLPVFLSSLKIFVSIFIMYNVACVLCSVAL